MNNAPQLGDRAPEFKAMTTQGPISFPQDYAGKWVVFFSHPGDFTPVCTTEIMTFAHMADEYKALNTELVGLSVDSNTSHIAWLRAMQGYKWKNMTDTKVRFPIIADVGMNVARMYGMLQPNASATATVRSVFIIDPEGRIRAILTYPLTTGRNMDEIKRLVQALQKSDKDKVATPADWRPGEPAIVPPAQTMEQADSRTVNPELYCLDWYLCFTDNMRK